MKELIISLTAIIIFGTALFIGINKINDDNQTKAAIENVTKMNDQVQSSIKTWIEVEKR